MKICKKKRFSRFKKIQIVGIIILLSSVLQIYYAELTAQESNKRPKVGLALSGGGAKGVAHIGVLKVMDEAGLKPDIITGVSMGSIVGGLYALGYSADSLEKIVRSIDWNLMLSDNIPENKVIFSEKHYFDNSVLTLPITKSRITIPSGLIKGQQIESALSRYAWPAANINDFSQLPIPFLCVATDINKCKKVDISGGYLADAMRASMAVPSVFTPIKIDSILFVDGGVVRNFAVTEIKEMGADIVIGSYTGGKLFNENELNSIASIMGQIGFYAGFYDSKDQMKLVDILIEPDLKKYSLASFKDVDSIIAIGYNAALPFKETFRKLADSLNSLGLREETRNILGKKTYTFDRIEITGNNSNTSGQILGVLGINPGDVVDNDYISQRIELLYGKVWFDKVKFLVRQINDSLILTIECYEKPGMMLTSSLHYDNYINTGLIIGFSARNIFTSRSKINLDSFIGQYYRLRFNYMQFIDRNQKYGVLAQVFSDKNFLPGLIVSGYMNECESYNSFYSLNLQNRIGLNQLLSLSTGIDNVVLIPNLLVNSSVKSITSSFLTNSLSYSVNTIDTKHFPNKGSLYDFKLSTSLPLSVTENTGTYKTKYTQHELGEYNFDRFYSLAIGITQYFSVGERLSFELKTDCMIITDTLSTRNNFYLLGGSVTSGSRSIEMTGYSANEIASKKFAGIGAKADMEIFRKIHLTAMINTFIAQVVGNGNRYSSYTGYGLEIGYLSIIGPVRAGIVYGGNSNINTGNKLKGFVSIGYNF